MAARDVLLVVSFAAMGAALYTALRRQPAVSGWNESPADYGGLVTDYTSSLIGAPDQYDDGPDAGGEGVAPAPADGFVDAGALDSFILPASYRVENIFYNAMGSRMEISLGGIAEIQRHEGVVLQPYKDQAGYWTIGTGHKLKRGEWWDSISPDFARELLVQDVGTAEDAVNSLVKVSLSQPMFDALVSLVFNIGAGSFRNSTLLRLLNAGDYAGAQAQFAVWNKVRVGGMLRVSSGLVARRADEAQLFASGIGQGVTTA